MAARCRINFSYWSRLSAIRVWEVAAMMGGWDPGELEAGEIVVNDYGDSPDLSKDERVLVSAILTSGLTSVDRASTPPDRTTLVTLSSVIEWLENHGQVELARKLGQGGGNCHQPLELSEPERRLRRLRDIGGTAIPSGHDQWRFTKMGELIAAEVADGHSRCSEKTIRSDLVKAIRAEAAAKRRGESSSVFAGLTK